jgi:hypothetical protein
MLDLKKLGLPGTYSPAFPLAPEPKTPPLRQKPMISFGRVMRWKEGEPLEGPEGAVVGGVVASLVQMDHFVRRAFDMGFFKTNIRFELKKLVQQCEKMLEVFASQYTSEVGDAANRLSGVLGQSAELLLNLSPRQVQSSLTHMHNMAQLNLDYVPVPVAPRGLLPTVDGWRLVAIESPYGGDVQENLRYLRACMRDCLSRRETPLAAHGLLTQPGVVDEGDAEGQQMATEAGVAWTQYAQATVVYTDRGVNRLMKEAIARAEHEGREVEYRTLPDWAAEQVSSATVELEESGSGVKELEEGTA